MPHPLTLVTHFAAARQLGPLRCGMSLQETQQILGAFHDRADDRRPRRWRPRLYFWDDLELLICHAMVVSINVPMWRDTVQLPAALDGLGQPQPALLLYPDVLRALHGAGDDCQENPRLVLDGESRGISTGAGVNMVFWPDARDDRLRLYEISKTDFSIDPGPHQDHGRLPDPPTSGH
ncbi:MAG TPA: hypothetical protein VIR33_08955 [Thermopolyspora sp.]